MALSIANDPGQTPGGGDELVNEIALDGIGRGEGIVVAEEPFEFMDAFVREEDDVASGGIVAIAVLGRLHLRGSSVLATSRH